MAYLEESIDEASGLPWLKIALGTAFACLLFQVFPTLWIATLWSVDIRNWTQAIWFGATMAALSLLLGIRFAPELRNEYLDQQERAASIREKKNQAESARRRREKVQQVSASRRRRIF